jgi:hypothetical protein
MFPKHLECGQHTLHYIFLSRLLVRVLVVDATLNLEKKIISQ